MLDGIAAEPGVLILDFHDFAAREGDKRHLSRGLAVDPVFGLDAIFRGLALLGIVGLAENGP